MKRFQRTTLLFFLILLSTALSLFLPTPIDNPQDECKPCDIHNVVRGIDYLGISTDITITDLGDSMEPAGMWNLFDFCCGENQQSDEYGNIIPEGILLNSIYDSQIIQNPVIATNIQQYQTSYSSQVTYTTRYYGYPYYYWGYPYYYWRYPFAYYRGVRTVTYQQIQQSFVLNQTVYSKIHKQFRNYQLQLADISMLNLNQETLNLIKNLPLNYTTQQDIQAYKDFINKVGTHFISKVVLGGKIEQEKQGNLTSFPVHDYINLQSSLDNVSNMTEKQNTKIIGGNPSLSNNYQLWLASLQEYPGIVEKQYSFISDIFFAKNAQNLPNINATFKNVLNALNEFFSYDGCTDPTAINYNSSAVYDDGSCIHKYYYGSFVTDTCNQFQQISNQTYDFTCPYNSQPVIFASHLRFTNNNQNPTVCLRQQNYNSYCNMTIQLCSSKSIQTSLSGYTLCNSNISSLSASFFNQKNIFTQSTQCPDDTIDIKMGTSISYSVLPTQTPCPSTSGYYTSKDVYCTDHLCVPKQQNQINSTYVMDNLFPVTNQYTKNFTCPNGTLDELLYDYNVSSIQRQQVHLCLQSH